MNELNGRIKQRLTFNFARYDAQSRTHCALQVDVVALCNTDSTRIPPRWLVAQINYEPRSRSVLGDRRDLSRCQSKQTHPSARPDGFKVVDVRRESSGIPRQRVEIRRCAFLARFSKTQLERISISESFLTLRRRSRTREEQEESGEKQEVKGKNKSDPDQKKKRAKKVSRREGDFVRGGISRKMRNTRPPARALAAK